MKKWFTQFPFVGWLLLILLLLTSDIGLYWHEKKQNTPENIAAKVQNHLLLKEKSIHTAIQKGYFSFPINKEALTLLSNNFLVVVFKKGKVVYWNSKHIPSGIQKILQPDSSLTPKAIHLGHGIYYVKTIPINDSNQSAICFIPIAYQYKYAHKYFHSYFVADAQIPSEVSIGNKGIAIENLQGNTVFHLTFKETLSHSFKISNWIGWLTIFFLIALFIWVHKVCIEIGKRYKPIFGWLVLFTFCLAFMLIRTSFGYPNGFANTGLFSPEILASGGDIHSFPDLFFYVIFDFWLLLYFVMYVPIRKLLASKNRYLNYLIKFTLIALLTYELFNGQATNVYTLVIDSKIPFVVNDLRYLTVYTFLSIALICLIALNFVFIISIIDDLLKGILQRKILRYLIFTIISLSCIWLLHNSPFATFNVTMLIISLAALILINQFGLPIRIFVPKNTISGTPQTYIWFFILCSWVTLLIFYFSYSKEKELRKIYAGRQEQQNTALMYYSFNTIINDLQQDKLLKTLWENPSAKASQSIGKHLIFHYLGGIFQKFNTKIYYYDAQMNPFVGQDTLDRKLIRKADSLSGKQFRKGLLSLQNPLGKNMYWGILPVFDNENKQKLGYIGIDFSIANSLQKSPTAMLLQPEKKPTDELYFNDYSYAIYRNHKLEAQSGQYAFPYRSYFDSKKQTYVFRDYWFYSNLFYRASPNELIVVRYHRNIGANLISLFSYVLAIWLLLSALFFITNYFVAHPEKGKHWRNRLNPTIRAKVNWTIMASVFLSLIVVGGITVSFLKNRYQETRGQNLRNLMFYFGQSIVHFIENKNALHKFEGEQLPNQYPELVYLLNTLAGEQGGEINLYNNKGKLMGTSQIALLQKGYLSTYINPSALNTLSNGMQPDWQTSENIGQLNYQSLYLPLRNKKDEIIAYLNLPYYASESMLKTEMSGILTTLINIYMLIFFIAGISAFLISNSIVRSFYLLIEQFRKIRLEHNVLIHWPYHDELGLLVSEYNNMILKVERMAAKLADSEREAAWRELALQVAHEIKNPLTPMKLNIQYLRKSVKNNHKNIAELTERISDSLIEQIENLNLIASEFAHFARMPDAIPEPIEVEEQLQSLMDLYQKDRIKMYLMVKPPNTTIWMDKNYFIRLFSNLIKNAIQAIQKDNPKGMLDIEVEETSEKLIRISIRDNGCGIPADIQKKIFTPYFTTKSSGTGIGLAMSKNMVEQSDGRIYFETVPNVGTIFYVELPKFQA